MVRKTGPASVSRREAEIPAAEAETAGAPWITASQLKAKPWPNKFMAIAARSGERPAFKVTGSRTAPTRATAGEGHKNSETKNMKIPSVHQAAEGVFMTRFTGAAIS